jgi:hypothetical protein
VGVPEVVAYLNSINMPRVVRLKTLVGKIVCTILSVSGSMTLGPEGTHPVLPPHLCSADDIDVAD